MGRLNVEQKEKIISNILLSKSINKIRSETKLAKSTIYYCYKKIKGKKYMEPKYEICFSEKEGEIVDIFAGDGSQYYYRPRGCYQTNIHFGNVNEYAHYVKKLFERYFNKKWNLWKEVTKEEHVKHRLRVIDKKIFGFFKNYLEYDSRIKHSTVCLKNLFFPRGFKIGFLRGLLDTDGCICLSQGRKRVAWYTTSRKLSGDTKKFLADLNIGSNTYKIDRSHIKNKNIFTTQIFEDEVDKFLKLVRPFKSKKLGR
jgi:hypothetical protein